MPGGVVMADPVALARRVLGDNGYLDTYRLRPRLDLAALLKHHGLEWHRRPFTGLAGAPVLFGAEYYVVTNSREGLAAALNGLSIRLGCDLNRSSRKISGSPTCVEIVWIQNAAPGPRRILPERTGQLDGAGGTSRNASQPLGSA